MLDKQLVSVKNFRGLDWKATDRIVGASLSRVIQNETPFDKSLDTENMIYMKNGSMRTRDGFEHYIKFGSVAVPFTINGAITGFWKINDLNGTAQTDRWLILSYNSVSGNGFLYDTQADGVTVTNPILTLAGMKYAFVLNAFGRMYISPWEGWAKPLGDAAGGGANNWLYLYNGLYNVRAAAGGEPTPGTFAVAAAAGGNMTPGLHFASVLYETDSGYITACPSTHSLGPLSATTTAANATMSFTNIPTGPTGTAKRHIIITKVVVNNNGQGLEGYEPFFAVTISDNTTTAITFTKPDSALVDTAKDHVASSLGVAGNGIIRPYVSMATFGSRMVYIGSRNSGTLVGMHKHIAISPPNSPEQIGSAVVGQGHDSPSALWIAPGFSGAAMSGIEINGTFYIFNEDSTFSVDEDTEDDPSTWPVNLVDAGKGAFPFSIASITDNPSGKIADGAIVLGHHGISFFNGRHSEVNFTDDIWDAFAFDSLARLQWSQIVVDPVRKIAFWKIGDPFNDYQTFCYFLDFKNGYSPDQIKFGKIQSQVFGSASILPRFSWLALREGYTNGTLAPTNIFDVHYPLLVIPWHTGTASGTTNSGFLLSEASVVGDGQTTEAANSKAIPWYYESGYTPNNGGEIYQFAYLRLRGVSRYDNTFGTPGTEYVTVEYGIIDDTTLTKLTPNDDLILGNTKTPSMPKKFITIPINARHEQIRIKLSGTNRTWIQQLALFGVDISKDRPR